MPRTLNTKTTTHDLAEIAYQKGIKYFLVNFLDLLGVCRAKLVPTSAIQDIQKNGAGFAGFATWLDVSPAQPDMWVMPDAQTFLPLIWKPEVAWVTGDVWIAGKELECVPRLILKRQIERATELGFRLKTGVECEFMLLTPDGKQIGDALDCAEKPAYEQMALMRRYDLLREVCDYMQQLGWKPYQYDHEDAHGQYEMNWEYDDCLITADRHSYFKYMIKTVAEKHGLRATFMPKPFSHLTGNGCHVHISLWDRVGKTNLFLDNQDEMGLSKLAYHFMAGVLHNAEGLCAFLNPTVNSYKRLTAAPSVSGASWSPTTITYSGNNRTHLIRIPEKGRFELRLGDGAVNPYLLQAAVLAAGLDGIQNKLDVGKRLDINMFTDALKLRGIKRLPTNLLDALRAVDKSRTFRAAFGDDIVDGYLKLKTGEWQRFTSTVSEWERVQTLDC